MPLGIEIIAQPFEVTFSGNPVPYTIGLSPYGTVERTQDIRIQLLVQAEATLNSNIFTDIRKQDIYPDVLGKVQFDIRSFCEAYLENQTPRATLSKPIRADKHRRRFRISVRLKQNGEFIGDAVNSDAIHVIKGGMAYEQFHYSEFFTDVIATQKKPLHYFTGKELTAPAEYKYLYWVYPFTDVATPQTVRFVLTMDDASTVTHDLADTIVPTKWGVFICPVGFTQVNLAAQVPGGRTCVSYTVSVLTIPGSPDPDVVVVDPVTFIMDYRQFYDSTQLLYTNSIGGIDTIRILGEIDSSADYASTNAERIAPPSGLIDNILQAQTLAANNDETEKFNGNTEFISKEKVNRLRDLLLSKNVYEVKNNKFIPVVINKKNVKFYNSKDNLSGMAIEWQNAFANQFYTPANLLPTTRTCPGMLKLVAKQITKNKLQILWALPMPYDMAELDIDNGTTHQAVTLFGNSGSQIVTFTNPAVYPDPEDITIKGRVVCDPHSNPQDTGAWTTIVISVIADTLPVANNDNFILAAGFTTPQTFAASILANDYDPDGDAIEVQPVTAGTTHAGGTIDIDAAGIVTYTPPTSIYNGIDYFDYTIEQSSNSALTATARIYINVGDTTVGNNVFARLGVENYYYETGGGVTQIGGEWFIYYYADPLGTIPKDVTSLGLTINVGLVYTELIGGIFVPTPSTFTVAASGIKNVIHSLGDYIFQYESETNGLETYWAYIYTLNTGTGYVLI